MSKNNSSNQDFTNNSDGFDITGGSTRRKLTVSGGDVAMTGSGSAVLTFPSTTDTMVGRASTDSLSNKTHDQVLVTNTNGTIEITAVTDGGDFNLFHTATGSKVLALYGSSSNTLHLNLLDGDLQTNSVTRLTNAGVLQNTRIQKLSTTTAGAGATPTINTDTTAYVDFTALAAAITSMTTNLSGTPSRGDTLWVSFTDNGTARAIAWGASFEASTVALPTTTVISTRLDVGFIWNVVTGKWRCVGAV